MSAMKKYGCVTDQRFVVVNTMVWTVAALLICMIFGFLFHFSAKWLEWTVTITGVMGMGVGFFGGIIFAMNHPEMEAEREKNVSVKPDFNHDESMKVEQMHA